MSYSSLWVMDKDFNGYEDTDFHNSWLFSPIAWDILIEKYMPYANRTFNGQKKRFKTAVTFNKSINNKLNEKINASLEQADRILWELAGQQVFFSKDKQFVADQIRRFIQIHSDCEELKKEHITERFNQIANSILSIDEQKFPYFIFKNTSCDDNVEHWFSYYDEKADEYEEQPLSEVEKYVTEFVSIEDGKIAKFTGNLDYFKTEE